MNQLAQLNPFIGGASMAPLSMTGKLRYFNREYRNRRCHSQNGMGAIAPMSIANMENL